MKALGVEKDRQLGEECLCFVSCGYADLLVLSLSFDWPFYHGGERTSNYW